MENKQDQESGTISPKKLLKRAKTWEISDSEDEEESAGIKVHEPQTNATQLSIQEESLPSNVASIEISCSDQRDTCLETGTEDPSGCIKEDNEQSCLQVNRSDLSLIQSPNSVKRTVKKTRNKKKPEDLETKRAEVEERKREKEVKKKENERIRSLEKEEKEKRKASAMALKLLRPDQCGKYMIVQIDAGLLQDAGSEDVLEALQSSGYNYAIEPHSVLWSIMWRREMPLDWTCVDGLELCKGEEDEMLILVEPKDFLSSVQCYIQNPANSEDIPTPGSVFGMTKKYPEKKVTLVVLGLRDYRRCQRLSLKMERHSIEPREGLDLQTSQSERLVTRQQIDEALVCLQLHHETEVLCLDTWRELGRHVCAMTKSLAQRPFRMHWEAQTYSFCTSTGSWRGWGPRDALSGLPLTWRRQIQQLNRVSPAMAATIAEAYPSPQLLMQAYAQCNSDQKRQALLCDLRVSRNAASAEDMDVPDESSCVAQGVDKAPDKERRIGPDVSRRMWLFMTATNPELVLDLNS